MMMIILLTDRFENRNITKKIKKFTTSFQFKKINMISCYSLSHINTVPDQTYFFQSLKKKSINGH